MSEQPNDFRLVAGQIIITKYLDEDQHGGVAVEPWYSEDLPLIDAMGMLAYAISRIHDDYPSPDADDEGES